MRRHLFGLVLVALGAACNNDTPDTTGDLVRPAGFALVPRGQETLFDGSEATRIDVFVADSESNGVRTLQMAGLLADAADPTSAFISQVFVSSPAIFFPLVMPAPGFPVEVAPGTGDRVYVLSPGSFSLDDATGTSVEFTGALHVLDVPRLDFGARVEDGYAPLAFPTNLADWVPGGVPVDLQMLPSEGDGDRLAVLFDAFGGAGAVVVATFDEAGALGETATLPVGRAPRDLVFDATRNLLLVAHAGETDAALHQLQWDGATLTATTTLDVGGPISSVVLAPSTSTASVDQALALRLDLTAVKRLVATSSGAYVADDRPSSLLLSTDDATAAEPGLVFLPSAAVTGASGFVEDFPDELADLSLDEQALLRPTDFAQTNVDTVMLALLDGRAAFLSGDPLRLRIDRNPRPRSVREATPAAGAVSVVDCGASTLQCTTAAANDCVDGSTSAIEIARPRSEATLYNVRYRGNLLTARDIAYTGALTNGGVQLTFPVDTTAAQLAPGDEARIQIAEWPNCTRPVLTGTVAAVGDGDLEVAISAAALGDCGAQEGPGSAERLEVYPVGEEIVVTRLDGDLEIVEVQQRAPIVGQRAQVAADVAFTVNVASGASCAPAAIGQVRCGSPSVCGAGRTCEAPSGDCPAYCSAGCSASSDLCRPDLTLRDCPGVDVIVDPVNLSLFDLDAASDASSAEEVNAVPYRTQWIDLAGGVWLTSFPGSRTMVRLRATASGFATQLTR